MVINSIIPFFVYLSGTLSLVLLYLFAPTDNNNLDKQQ
jgi:hypothetical protein